MRSYRSIGGFPWCTFLHACVVYMCMYNILYYTDKEGFVYFICEEMLLLTNCYIHNWFIWMQNFAVYFLKLKQMAPFITNWKLPRFLVHQGRLLTCVCAKGGYSDLLHSSVSILRYYMIHFRVDGLMDRLDWWVDNWLDSERVDQCIWKPVYYLFM